MVGIFCGRDCEFPYNKVRNWLWADGSNLRANQLCVSCCWNPDAVVTQAREPPRQLSPVESDVTQFPTSKMEETTYIIN